MRPRSHCNRVAGHRPSTLVELSGNDFHNNVPLHSGAASPLPIDGGVDMDSTQSIREATTDGISAKTVQTSRGMSLQGTLWDCLSPEVPGLIIPKVGDTIWDTSGSAGTPGDGTCLGLILRDHVVPAEGHTQGSIEEQQRRGQKRSNM